MKNCFIVFFGLAACAPPRGNVVDRAFARAQLTPARARVLQLSPARVLLASPLEAALPDSDAAPEYRVLAYDTARDEVRELLPRAQFAQLAGTDVLAVEQGALRLHQGAAVRTLLTHVAPDFAIDPSNRWIAAVVRKPDLPLDTDLVLMPIHGGFTRTIAAFDGSSESRPIFSPDDRFVLFVSGKSGLASIWRAELATGRIDQLTNVGLRGQGELPKEFVPPPLDMAAAHWDGTTLVYAANGREVRLDAEVSR